jgi:hypothetical protein
MNALWLLLPALTPEQIAAMWSAYQGASETATVAELRVLMEAAANPPKPEPEDFSREALIGLCRDGLVPQEKWSDRDTARAQQQLGALLALLSAGCDFTARPGHRGMMLDVRVEYRGFSWFEGGFDYDEDRDMYLEHDDFYVPTRARLTDVDGGDWYC